MLFLYILFFFKDAIFTYSVSQYWYHNRERNNLLFSFKNEIGYFCKEINNTCEVLKKKLYKITKKN